MNWITFWTAVGAIGTSFGSIMTAVAVWLSFKPYERRITVLLEMESTDEGRILAIRILNTGHSLYMATHSLYHRRKIIVQLVQEEPILIPQDSQYREVLGEQDMRTIIRYMRSTTTNSFTVHIVDINGRVYKCKMDVKGFRPFLCNARNQRTPRS